MRLTATVGVALAASLCLTVEHTSAQSCADDGNELLRSFADAKTALEDKGLLRTRPVCFSTNGLCGFSRCRLGKRVLRGLRGLEPLFGFGNLQEPPGGLRGR